MSETVKIENVLASIRQAVLDQKKGRTWRAFAAEVQVPHSTLHFIGTGQWSHVAWENARFVCRRLHIPDPGVLVVTVACPTCGEPHLAGDCHGRPVAQVVCLGPDEVVAPAPAPKRKLPPRPPCLRPRLSLDPHVRLQQLTRLVGQAVREIGIEERGVKETP